jgi:hypothetical protein
MDVLMLLLLLFFLYNLIQIICRLNHKLYGKFIFKKNLRRLPSGETPLNILSSGIAFYGPINLTASIIFV